MMATDKLITIIRLILDIDNTKRSSANRRRVVGTQNETSFDTWAAAVAADAAAAAAAAAAVAAAAVAAATAAADASPPLVKLSVLFNYISPAPSDHRKPMKSKPKHARY
jgi:hypothetical protein